MAWLVSLSAECGPERGAADTFAEYFQAADIPTRVFQDDDGNWWCSAMPRGVSWDDESAVDEVIRQLHGLLHGAPAYRYALAGVEVDEFRLRSELTSSDLDELAGLVLCETLWHEMERPPGYESFAPGYLWRPLT